MRARIGDSFKSKINGKKYLTERVDENAVCLTWDTQEKLTVPADVLENFFVYAGNDTPVPVPEAEEFTVSEGRLLHYGKQVETGTLIPVNIQGLLPGGVILSVKSRSEGLYDLFVYDIIRDLFFNVFSGYDSYRIVFSDGTNWGCVAEREEEYQTDGKEPEKMTGIHQVLGILNGTRMITEESAEEDGYLFGDLIFMSSDGADESKKTVLLFSGHEAVKEESSDTGEIFFTRHPEIDGKKCLVRKYTVSVCADENESCTCAAGRDDVLISGIPERVIPASDGNFIFVTGEGIVHSNYGHYQRVAKGEKVLSAVKKYPYFLNLDAGRTVNVFTFGNEDFRMCEIMVEKTRDRGYVTTVSEH